VCEFRERAILGVVTLEIENFGPKMKRYLRYLFIHLMDISPCPFKVHFKRAPTIDIGDILSLGQKHVEKNTKHTHNGVFTK